jgi:hypothetical protein
LGIVHLRPLAGKIRGYHHPGTLNETKKLVDPTFEIEAVQPAGCNTLVIKRSYV